MKSVTLPVKPAPAAEAPPTRRSWIDAVGAGAVVLALGGQTYALLRSLEPNVLYEPPKRFKAGLPDDFPEGATFLEEQRVFVFRDQRAFHAISAVCTHLGCTVKLVNLGQTPQGREFHCPCHGSKYRADGANYAGPAPRPLAWYRLEVSPDDGQLVVDLSQPVPHDFRLRI